MVDRLYPTEFEKKDTTDTTRSASYLDLHLEIYSEVQLRTKLFNKRDEFNFPIVNFPFIINTIPVTPVSGVYIYISVDPIFHSYQDFLDKGLPLTRKLLNQVNNSKAYDHHHDLVNHYGVIRDTFHLH